MYEVHTRSVVKSTTLAKSQSEEFQAEKVLEHLSLTGNVIETFYKVKFVNHEL